MHHIDIGIDPLAHISHAGVEQATMKVGDWMHCGHFAHHGSDFLQDHMTGNFHHVSESPQIDLPSDHIPVVKFDV